MVSFSKLFKDGIQHRSCGNDLMHPDSCLVNFLKDILPFLLSNVKYLFPIIFAPLLTKIRKLNKNLLLDTLRYYCEAVVTNTLVAVLCNGMICTLRQLLGKYNSYTCVWLPASIGGLFTLLTSPRVQRLMHISILQCSTESLLIRRANFLTKTIANSVGIQCCLFMCCSAVLMHAKQIGMYRGFWLLKPNSKKDFSSNNDETLPQSPCVHQEQDCSQYLLKGVRNYFSIGLGVEILKTIMRPMPARNISHFMAKLFVRLKNIKLNSTAFLVSYMGIYRSAHCYFNHKSNNTADLNHLAAGFLGGLCYIFYPKLSLLSYGLVLSIQTLLKVFWSQLKTTDAKYGTILVAAKQIPYEVLLYSTFLGYLVHTYCFHKHLVGSMAGVVINGTVNNKARKIHFSIEKTRQLLEAGVKNIYGTYYKPTLDIL